MRADVSGSVFTPSIFGQVYGEYADDANLNEAVYLLEDILPNEICTKMCAHNVKNARQRLSESVIQFDKFCLH